MTTTKIAVALLAAALTLVGCGGDDDDDDATADTNSTTTTEAPSEDCLRLFRTADLTDNPEAYGPPLAESLTVCETVDQWITGLEEYPGALGITEARFIDPAVSLSASCGVDDFETPVCAEAVEDGLIPAP